MIVSAIILAVIVIGYTLVMFKVLKDAFDDNKGGKL